MPGGFLARKGELVKVMLDTARGLVGQAGARIGSKRIAALAPDYRSEVAKFGLPVEDFASATLSMVPRFQGELNNLGKIEAGVQHTGDIISATGRLMNDVVAGNNDMVAARSGVRQARAYIKLAMEGKLKQSDLARLTNNSMSNESIAWLKAQKGKKIGDIPDAEASEFARELGSNIVQRLERRLANPAFNQKFINDPLLRDHFKFMNYQFTALRATEDTVKNLRAVLKSDAPDKWKSAADIVGGLGTRLMGTAAGGAIAMYLGNMLMERGESDLAKESLLGRVVASIGATNIFGTAGIAGDMVLGGASANGVPGAAKMRKYASYDGKEQRPRGPDEMIFTASVIENAAKLAGALAGYPVLKAAEMAGTKLKTAPEKLVAEAAKANLGALNKAMINKAGGPNLSAPATKKKKSIDEMQELLRGGGGGSRDSLTPNVSPGGGKKKMSIEDAQRMLRSR
jgi:hypothetical protein